MSGHEGLPSGWISATLGSIRVDRASSIDPARHATETFELYSIPAYPSGRPEVVKGREVGSAKKSLDPGTVVISKINPRINRVWVVGARAAHRQIGSSEWIPFFPVEGVAPKYLAYYMRQDQLRNYLAANVSGVGGSLMRVKPSTVDPFPFTLAPSPEQQRIVSAIESYFTRLDDAVATLERVQRNLKRYRASVLKGAVEGRLVPTEDELARAEGRDYEPASVLLERILAERRRRWEEMELANMNAKGKAPKDNTWKARYVEPVAPQVVGLPTLPDGWCWASIEQLAFLVRNGYSKKPARDGAVRILRISAVRSLSVDFADARWLPGSPEDYSEDLVAQGDLLFTRYNGSPELVGVAGLVRGVDRPTVHPDKLIKVRFLASKLDLAYLELACNTGASRLFVEGRTRTTAGQAGISGGDIKQMPIPLPPRAEQSRISTEAERLLTVAHASRETLVASALRTTRLRQSILKWAFEGRLVDQDPTDEPASILLERIRAECETSNEKPPRGPRRPKAHA